MAGDRNHRTVLWSAARLALVAGVALSTLSCGPRDGQGSSYLVINSLLGASGATPQELGTDVSSDVITISDDVATFYEDIGQVTLSLALKDAGPPASPNVPSPNNFITVNRYRVVYTRADGRNTPGVDVPHPFDGAMTVTVGGGSVSAGFTLVRAQAKIEPPLLALRGGNGAIFIATIAEVTFYGRDQTGREVSATGHVGVTFSDWGDPN